MKRQKRRLKWRRQMTLLSFKRGKWRRENELAAADQAQGGEKSSTFFDRHKKFHPLSILGSVIKPFLSDKINLFELFSSTLFHREAEKNSSSRWKIVVALFLTLRKPFCCGQGWKKERKWRKPPSSLKENTAAFNKWNFSGLKILLLI